MLYRLQKKNIEPAISVLANAFQNDPLWKKIYEGQPDIETKLRPLFEVPLRYTMKYGEVYAISENLEGVIAWLPRKYADMTLWRSIRAGGIMRAKRIGWTVAKKLGAVSGPITQDRHRHMSDSNYIYIVVVGVAIELHSRGYGRKLIDAAIEKSEAEGCLLYLETETEENVKMYEHFGFKLLQKITLPVVHLPLWEMARKPQGGRQCLT